MIKWLLPFLLWASFASAQTISPTACFATISVNSTPVLANTATIGPSLKGCQFPTSPQFDGYVWVLNEAASAGLPSPWPYTRVSDGLASGALSFWLSVQRISGPAVDATGVTMTANITFGVAPALSAPTATPQPGFWP
jgi:hypothetical protein